MDYFFAGIALLFCLYGSYTDLQSGRIPNVCSFGLIYAGVIAQLLFVINGSTSITAAGTTIFVGGVLFFVLYWFGFWAAGDAKLCWGVSMMLPLSFFQDTKMGINFPPAVLLINISIIYFFSLSFIFWSRVLSIRKNRSRFISDCGEPEEGCSNSYHDSHLHRIHIGSVLYH